jgi:hypothetical protein
MDPTTVWEITRETILDPGPCPAIVVRLSLASRRLFAS